VSWFHRGAVLALALAACGETRIPDFHGVRLGMTPREVRDRFDVHGDFRVSTDSATDDITMRFEPGQSAAVTSAQFEFHMGALVAVRADVTKADPAWSGDDTTATRAEVLHRDRSASVTHIDWLSRECPTHAAEANRLAGKP
jgi:hypothetical protein